MDAYVKHWILPKIDNKTSDNLIVYIKILLVQNQ